MLKKTSDDAKKRIVFFIDFSSIFREKSTENHAKSVETSFVHKNRRKRTFGTPFFSKKSIFSEFWFPPGSPLIQKIIRIRTPKTFSEVLRTFLTSERFSENFGAHASENPGAKFWEVRKTANLHGKTTKTQSERKFCEVGDQTFWEALAKFCKIGESSERFCERFLGLFSWFFFVLCWLLVVGWWLVVVGW